MAAMAAPYGRGLRTVNALQNITSVSERVDCATGYEYDPTRRWRECP
jgi:hypothetical protein